MATIAKRESPSGKVSWRAIVRRTGIPTQSATFESEEAAKEWAQLVDGDAVERQNRIKLEKALEKIRKRSALEVRTFGDILGRYRDEVTPDKRGAADEVVRLNALIKSPLAKLLVEKLSTEYFAAWRDARLKIVSASTVIREINLLSHVIKIARSEWGVRLPDNPFRALRRPKSGPPRERRLRKGEEAALMLACEQTRNPFVRPVIIIALETAMRRGEIVPLDWTQVNLGRRSICLMRTKNGASRGVPLSGRAIEVFESLAPKDSGPVFPGLTTEALKLAFARAVKRAGLEDFHFHDLRHEATSRVVEKGLTVLEVAAVTGHKDLRMLQRYTHLQMEDLARKLDRHCAGA
ncbi:Site-specific recombinase XerD [Cupriavidus sp. YR651]|uniref:integrase n=1 Tax=Cupriavidus sp. YR651 TaxID=1855315 RepID=UPI00087E7064|nr:site-specific integrase [Cupriavidus sp. YR651]SDD22228.1 Site-specific recombinase XerD [Cupriavidus sp. YR651]